MIPALILTFDRQIGLAELLYKRYMESWPDCPLTFRVPINCETSSAAYFRDRGNVELIRTSAGVLPTMRNLLSGLGDMDWVYWCIDDRLPLTPINSMALGAITAALDDLTMSWQGIKLFHWRERIATEQAETFGGVGFAQQTSHSLWGFYHHHFIRAWVLRWFFFSPPDVTDEWTLRDLHRWHLAHSHHPECVPCDGFLVPREKIIPGFIEPVREGKLTVEARSLLKEYACHEIPEMPILYCAKHYE